LSVIEALACGTPVIAFRRGAMPELIDHGVTGFLVDTVEEAAACIERVSELDRRACRAAAEQRFSVDRMADEYVRLYRRIVSSE
jgi:glycosyltransferase involved in cell wall biosynthesis